MQSYMLRLLPGPENLGARLAMFLLPILLIGAVLFVFTVVDMAGYAPVDLKQTFAWVVVCASLALLLVGGGLWYMIFREVLRPLEQMRLQEAEGPAGLGQVAATMRELREEVNRTQAELDESNRNLRHVEKLAMVGKLAAGVAHSVRNPLTSVKLRLFSLERAIGADTRSGEDLAVISDAIKHVDGIVGSFLEFSRRPRLKPERISLSSVVDATLRLMESRLAIFPVSLSIQRTVKLPLVYADPEQLREALLNILGNACEAMEYFGTLRVEECLVDKGSNGVFACIRVQDSGPGIAESILPEIFTPFFSTKDQGTGLGLPIAKSILEEHGGDIEVSSSAQGGTCFSLLLPVTLPGRPYPGRSRLLRADVAAPE